MKRYLLKLTDEQHQLLSDTAWKKRISMQKLIISILEEHLPLKPNLNIGNVLQDLLNNQTE